jgi:hypothetical protein
MAVIQVEDKVKQVKVGDYMGLDFGMVTLISDAEVQLRELIQDSAGDWTERKSSLYLQSKEGARNEIHQTRNGRTAGVPCIGTGRPCGGSSLEHN